MAVSDASAASVPLTAPLLVIVKVSGGRVQGTVTNVPGIDVLVLDYDTEGAEPDELRTYPETDGDEDEAIAYYESPLVDAGYVRQLVSIERSDETTQSALRQQGDDDDQ